jgi:hypothetical protein
MKKAATFFCILCGLFISISATAEHPLEYLHGTWEGTGRTSGMVSSVRFTWGPALGGQYTTLQIHNTMSGSDGQPFLFEGIAYYQPAGDANEKSLKGVWVDNRGDILPLQATLEPGVLTAHWGNDETELGRSQYRLLDDGTLEAIDSVMNDAGEWREFGHAILSRTP